MTQSGHERGDVLFGLLPITAHKKECSCPDHETAVRQTCTSASMPEIKTEFLFTIDLDFEIFVLGETPYGMRRIARLNTGSFDGPKLKGAVLPGGGAWTLIRRDDVLDIEVRLILETNDKHQIYMQWRGLRDVPKDVMERLHRNETVDPETYYFRATPYFETSSEKYGWLNRICAIATGSLAANARTIDVFQVL
jgi:Protein of unknown function (DUF3237)